MPSCRKPAARRPAAAALLALGLLGLAPAAHADLFVSDPVAGTVDRVTPSGQVSPFASGLIGPAGLAFDAAGNLFVADVFTVDRVTPSGQVSPFASGFNNPTYLAFGLGEGLPLPPRPPATVPEPASLLLWGLGLGAALRLAARRRCHRTTTAASANST